MEPATAVTIVDQIAQALGAAHADGIVHRDVKPSNVIVGNTGFAYLVGFGITRSLGADTGLTGTDGAIGTLDYMAPERFTSAPLPFRVDVYSLTCVPHQCLTSTKPFAGATAASQISARQHDEPPRASACQPGLSTAFDRVVARGMAKDPANGTPAQLTWPPRRQHHVGVSRPLTAVRPSVRARSTAPRVATALASVTIDGIVFFGYKTPHVDNATPQIAAPAILQRHRPVWRHR